MPVTMPHCQILLHLAESVLSLNVTSLISTLLARFHEGNVGNRLVTLPVTCQLQCPVRYINCQLHSQLHSIGKFELQFSPKTVSLGPITIQDDPSRDLSLSLSLSLSLFPSRGVGHCPNPFKEALQASQIGWHSKPGPCLPPSLIMCWALEDQMLRHLFSAVAMGQVAESRRLVWCKYVASNGDWPVDSWATVTHWSLVQSRCQRWWMCSLSVKTLWTREWGLQWCLPSAMLVWCDVRGASAAAAAAAAAITTNTKYYYCYYYYYYYVACWFLFNWSMLFLELLQVKPSLQSTNVLRRFLWSTTSQTWCLYCHPANSVEALYIYW